MTTRRPKHLRRLSPLLLAAVCSLALPPSTPAQQTAATSSSFEIASIRRNNSGGPAHFGPTPDGYRATNLPLMVSVLMAYIPVSSVETMYYTTDRIRGTPDWAQSDRYNIEAKVAEADLAQWAKPEAQKVMLRAMLQTLLTERSKLVVHRETSEMTIYSLLPGKNGAKLTPADPDARHADGITLPGGGILVPGHAGQVLNFYGASMASLAQVLSNFAGHPVQDKTGLSGRYDFALQKSDSGQPSAEEAESPMYRLDSLGLHLQRARGTVETLVIDHIERPSEN